MIYECIDNSKPPVAFVSWAHECDESLDYAYFMASGREVATGRVCGASTKPTIVMRNREGSEGQRTKATLSSRGRPSCSTATAQRTLNQMSIFVKRTHSQLPTPQRRPPVTPTVMKFRLLATVRSIQSLIRESEGSGEDFQSAMTQEMADITTSVISVCSDSGSLA